MPPTPSDALDSADVHAHRQSARPGCSPPRREAPPLPLTPGWVAAAPGADYCVREAGGGLARIAAVRVNLAQYRVEVADLAHGGKKSSAGFQPASPPSDLAHEGETLQTVRDLASARGAVLAINGGYFDEHWHPLGALVHAGKQTNPPFRGDGGIFCVVQGRATLRSTRQGLPPGVTEALQCHPRLVASAQATPRFKPGEAVRAAVGLTAPGEVILAVTCRGELSPARLGPRPASPRLRRRPQPRRRPLLATLLPRGQDGAGPTGRVRRACGPSRVQEVGAGLKSGTGAISVRLRGSA